MIRFISMVVAGAVLACGLLSSQASAATKLTLLYTTSNAYIGSYVAKDQGFFDKHGLDVDLTLAQNGSVISAAMVADSAQVGTPTPPVLLQADEQGLDLVVVAGGPAYPISTFTGVLARTDSGVKAAADLVGRKVGTPGFGGNQDILAKTWVHANGVDYHKVDWVELTFQQMADALKSSLTDAVVAVDPYYSHIVDSKIGYMIGDTSAGVPRGTASVVYASTRSWATTHSQEVVAFRTALDDATHYVNDPANAAAVRDSMAKYTKLPPQSIASSPIPDTLNVHVTGQSVAFWIKASHDQGLIKGNPDPASLIAP